MLCNYRSPTTLELSRCGDEARKEGLGWNTEFPDGETQGPIGGLRLQWASGARRRRKAVAGAARSGDAMKKGRREGRKDREARGEP
jgi:hypothetical protein